MPCIFYHNVFKRPKWFYVFCFCNFAVILFFYYRHYANPVHRNPRLGPGGTKTLLAPPSGPPSFNSAPNSKVILLWTSFYDKWVFPHGDPKECPQERSCEVTNDRSRLAESDAVVFHIRDIDMTDLPRFRKPSQRWVFFNLEPPPYSYFLGFRFMRKMFNWTMTYRLDSDIVVPYGWFEPKPRDAPAAVENVAEYSGLKARNKSSLAYWMVSHCSTSSRRENYVRSLSEYLEVDVYGRCGKATCPKDKTQKCLEKLSDKYFFAFAMENSLCKDYVSEKFFEAAKYGAVPVVLGGADYSKLIPRHSYIDVSDFDSPKALAAYLEKLSKSKGIYRTYFQWRENFVRKESNMFCDLCHKLKISNDSDVKVYDDMVQWWVNDADCKRWPTATREMTSQSKRS